MTARLNGVYIAVVTRDTPDETCAYSVFLYAWRYLR